MRRWSQKRARRALQSFQLRCSASGVAARNLPPGVRCPLRGITDRSSARIGWTLPLCRWPFPRLCGFPSFGPAGYLSVAGTEPLSSFALRRSVAQRNLASRVSPASSSLGLSFPSALQDSEVHIPRALPDPLRSAHRVCLPSRRLTPSEPEPALFHAGGALGI
jgi:hypothetical protein